MVVWMKLSVGLSCLSALQVRALHLHRPAIVPIPLKLYHRLLSSNKNNDIESIEVNTPRGRRKPNLAPTRQAPTMHSQPKVTKVKAKPEVTKPIEKIPIPPASERITIKNTQQQFVVDEEAIRNRVAAILDIMKMGSMETDILICSDEKMRHLNSVWRNKRKSTDILSVAGHEFARPGVFNQESRHAIASGDHYLGDIVICPAYVNRVMLSDAKLMAETLNNSEINGENNNSSSSPVDLASLNSSLVSDTHDEDAGVSKAMMYMQDLNERILLLLVHGVLHLMGYDHETDPEWREMTAKEDFVLNALNNQNSTPKS